MKTAAQHNLEQGLGHHQFTPHPELKFPAAPAEEISDEEKKRRWRMARLQATGGLWRAPKSRPTGRYR